MGRTMRRAELGVTRRCYYHQHSKHVYMYSQREICGDLNSWSKLMLDKPFRLPNRESTQSDTVNSCLVGECCILYADCT